MGIVSGDDVAALQHQADQRAIGHITAALIPIEVFPQVFKHLGRQGMPDALIWKHHRFSDLEAGPIVFAFGIDVFVGQHQQEVAQVVRRASQPVLEAEHEAAGVLGFFNRQVLEHRWQGVQQLQHRVLEAGSTGLLALAHEVGDGALALAELGHREAAQLVEPHHLRH